MLFSLRHIVERQAERLAVVNVQLRLRHDVADNLAGPLDIGHVVRLVRREGIRPCKLYLPNPVSLNPAGNTDAYSPGKGSPAQCIP